MESLRFVLERAQKLGFIGKNSDLAEEIKHSWEFGSVAFEALFAEISDIACWDAGSGGGLPALPVCVKWPASRWVLNDLSAKKCDFLEWAVLRLGINASVHNGPVEKAAEMPEHKMQYKIVTARAFGSIERTVQSTQSLLAEKSYLLVSSPPKGRSWPEAILERFDLREHAGISVLRKKSQSSA